MANKKTKPELSDSQFFDFNPLLDRLEELLDKRVEEERYRSAAVIKQIIDLLASDNLEMTSKEVDRWGELHDELLTLNEINQ